MLRRFELHVQFNDPGRMDGWRLMGNISNPYMWFILENSTASCGQGLWLKPDQSLHDKNIYYDQDVCLQDCKARHQGCLQNGLPLPQTPLRADLR